MTTKIAISLPDHQVARAREAVSKGEAASVSAFISQAIATFDGEADVEEFLAEMARVGGEPTAEHKKWARRVLDADLSDLDL